LSPRIGHRSVGRHDTPHATAVARRLGPSHEIVELGASHLAEAFDASGQRASRLTIPRCCPPFSSAARPGG